LSILGLGQPDTIWAAILAIATAAGSLALILAVYIGRIELRSIGKDREFQAAIEIFRDFVEISEAREFVRSDLPGRLEQARGTHAHISLDTLPDDTLPRVRTVANFFERLGVLVDQNLVSQRLVFDLMSWSVVTCWDCSRPIIHEWRRDATPALYENFELLVELARKWQTHRPTKNIQLRLDEFERKSAKRARSGGMRRAVLAWIFGLADKEDPRG
jgi:hypothetical protein